MSIECPKCHKQAKEIDYLEIQCIFCEHCGYDESQQYEVYPEQKTSQKAKGSYSPYKSGGSKRSRK